MVFNAWKNALKVTLLIMIGFAKNATQIVKSAMI
jgi:hypothetical protein